MSMLTPFQSRRRSPSLLHLFDDVFGDFFPAARPAREWTSPAMNLVESDAAFTIEFELPGLEEKEIQVQVHGDQLTINAERKFESEKKDGEYHRVEHRYGALSRSLTLPREIDAERVEASYKRGILTVVLPKAESTSAKRIQVKGD